MATTTLSDKLLAPLTDSRPLNIAMVDEELPYPPTSGKRVRTLNLTMRLAAKHRITYICHRNADSEEAQQAIAFFLENGVTPVVVPRSVPPRSGARFYARLAANVFSPLPYSVSSHMSHELREALRHHMATQPVDLWHCEWTPYAEALRGTVDGPKVVVAHNVESLIWRRYYETERNPLRRWYIARQWRKFDRFERRVLGEVTRVVAVSEMDAARLHDDFGVENVDVVENGVDTAFFQPSVSQREPTRLLFLGSLDWRPNLDGVRILLDSLFPALKSVVPGASLRIVGRNPPGWLQQRVARSTGVELYPSVPDVRPFLADCGLMLVPLRIGGGSRIKILEALASGVPVVTTRIGVEGLCLAHGKHLDVADDVDAMLPALLMAIRDHASRIDQAAEGRQAVLKQYDWDMLAGKMERVWYSCVQASNVTNTCAA